MPEQSTHAAPRFLPAAGEAGCRSEASVLWSAATGSFDGPRLRRAIVLRGWTVQEFAEAAGLTAASIYSALRGRKV